MDLQPDPAGSRGASAPAVAAILAVLLGLAALVVGVFGLVERLATDSEAATTVAATTATSPPTSTGPAVADLVTITDDTESLSVSVPAEWTEVSGGPWVVDGEEVGLSLFAAVDRTEWYEGWGSPGAFIGVTTVGGDVYAPELGDFSGDCEHGSQESPEIGGFTTLVQEWVDCGSEGSRFEVALVWPESFAYGGLIQVITLEGEAPILETILSTLSHEP